MDPFFLVVIAGDHIHNKKVVCNYSIADYFFIKTLRYGVVATAAPGVTTQQSAEGEPAAFDWAIFGDGLQGVGGAGGGEATRGGGEWRDAVTVELDQNQQWPREDPFTGASESLPGTF